MGQSDRITSDMIVKAGAVRDTNVVPQQVALWNEDGTAFTGGGGGGEGFELPAGGLTDQALVKASDADGDVTWAAGGGGGGFALSDIQSTIDGETFSPAVFPPSTTGLNFGRHGDTSYPNVEVKEGGSLAAGFVQYYGDITAGGDETGTPSMIGATTQTGHSGQTWGSVAFGMSLAYGIIQSTGSGSLAHGLSTYSQGVYQLAAYPDYPSVGVKASGVGSHAHGSTSEYASYGITASGAGSTAFGRSFGGGGGAEAAGHGSLAFGYSHRSAIAAAGDGALAFGKTWTGGGITAAKHGSFAGGYIKDTSGARTGEIAATAYGSFAFGYTLAYDSIQATATNSVQFGEGVNAQANSLAVGTDIRIGSEAPSTPRNGDIWAANGYLYGHANNATGKIQLV